MGKYLIPASIVVVVLALVFAFLQGKRVERNTQLENQIEEIDNTRTRIRQGLDENRSNNPMSLPSIARERLRQRQDIRKP